MTEIRVQMSTCFCAGPKAFEGAQFGAPGTFTADKEWIKVFGLGLEFGFD